MNWEAECKAFNLLPTNQKPGQASILVTLALKSLQPRMSSFAGRCRERIGGLPDIKELVHLMVAEDEHQKQFNKNDSTQNVSAASASARRRGGRGRSGRRGQQQQQQQSQLLRGCDKNVMNFSYTAVYPILSPAIYGLPACNIFLVTNKVNDPIFYDYFLQEISPFKLCMGVLQI